jgi:hypothetical protein
MLIKGYAYEPGTGVECTGKGMKHIFILKRFKYGVKVYHCSLGEVVT